MLLSSYRACKGHVSSEGFKLIVEATSEEDRAEWITAICTTLVAKTEVAPQDIEKAMESRGAAGGNRGGGGKRSTAGGAAASTPLPIVKDGVLRKKAIGKSMLGSMRQNWKDRYFCLTSDRLEYFGKKGDAKAKGGVDVSNINGVEVWSGGPGPGFEIHCNVLADGHVDSAGYKLVCEAETEEERTAWINAICTALVAKTQKTADSALKEGPLRKKARNSMMVNTGMAQESWKERYFRLTSTRFEYFASKGARKGGVNLKHIDGFQIAEGLAEFEVRYSSVLPDGSSKQYKLVCQAETKAVRDEWLAAIRAAKDALV